MDQNDSRDHDLEIEAERLAKIIPIYIDLYMKIYSINHIAHMIKRDFLLEASIDQLEVMLAPSQQEETSN